MKTFAAFLRLIRWPNLVFIAITQMLFYYCVVDSVYLDDVPQFSHYPQLNPLFYLLIAASILIAAAGYIINDYFDLQIDEVNKPDKVVVGKMLKRRWAIAWHLLLSGLGILVSAYVSYKTGKWVIAFANAGCVLLLWFYSTVFKRKLLSGNIMIAALTAWVIVVVYFFSGASILNYKGWLGANYPFDVKKLYKFCFLYAGFAFIVSLVREVVKDLEDMNGDARYDCKTMPISWGVPATKVFAAVWLVVCIAALGILQVYAWQSGWYAAALYCIIAIMLPMGIVLKRLYEAVTPADYHRVSNMVKLVMLTGILSMLFFKFHV